MVGQGFVDQRYKRVKEYDTPVSQMTERPVTKLPAVENVKYKEVVTINVAMLFCDIKGYTKLVTEASDPKTVARIMTIYVTEMAAAIREHGGTILSIRGDGLIGTFVDGDRNASTEAVRCAVTMNTILDYVVNKQLKSFKQESLVCHWGADSGRIKITRAGLYRENMNDLVYIGDAINHASKFSVLAQGNQIAISEKMHNRIDNEFKKSDSPWEWTPERDTVLG
ncbi:hypothetical protein LCGC14_3136740, partial [marine sediment metagenome]